MRQQSYFSLDYRSPPSGVGQIVPEGATQARNMILITAGDDGPDISPFYKETVYFPHNLWEEETRGKARKFFEDLFQKHNVNHVYDSEMSWIAEAPQVGPAEYSPAVWLDTIFGEKS